jgi:hypothetical protein
MALIGSERGRGRRRPSSVDRLDPKIKELIGTLRIDHGWTIDEIRERLVQLVGDSAPSRSALGRHVKSVEEIGAELRHSREIANALTQQLGDAPEDKTAELTIELMHSMVLRLLTTTKDGEPLLLDPESAMQLGRTLSSLAGARKTNQEMIRKQRDEATKEAAKKAVSAAKSKGIGADTVEFIRKAVLGSEG